jgi:ubiquinone biosynthesis protein
MSEQVGLRGLKKALELEAPNWAHTLPQIPRLVHQTLSRPPAPDLSPLLAEIAVGQRRQNVLLAVIAALLAGILVAPFFF